MEQNIKPTITQKVVRFSRECVRVLKVTRKPSKEEFSTILKMSGLGSVIIGMVGFIIEIIGFWIKG